MVRLGEMHAHYYVSSMHYSILDAGKTQHVAVESSESWRKLKELIAARPHRQSAFDIYVHACVRVCVYVQIYVFWMITGNSPHIAPPRSACHTYGTRLMGDMQ